MAITIQATDVQDALTQLNQKQRRSFAISVEWKTEDYGRMPETGCSVFWNTLSEGRDLGWANFDSAQQAAKYIGAVLRQHDKWVKEERKRIAKEKKQTEQRKT